MAEKLPLDPECRILDGASGVPAVLADGNAWLLADGGLLNGLDELRDRLFDQSTLGGRVEMIDVMRAAEWLLLANYDLELSEVGALVFRADHQALADAVCEALFGPSSGQKTYTAWAASALLANGLDPATIPVALMPDVLAQLEAGGRCIPRGKFIDSAIAAPRLAAARARAAAHKAALEQSDETEPDHA